MDEQNQNIRHALRLVETGNISWAFPALLYLEEIQIRSSMKFTIKLLKEEVTVSSNPARNRWSAWLDRLEKITLQKGYVNPETIQREAYYIWFHRLNFSLWSRLVSHVYSAEVSFRNNNQRNYIGGQSTALDFIVEEEHQGSKEAKLKIVDEVVAYGHLLLLK
ncbi:MAG: hypothetical protein AAF840_07920 [Bacteroidota bacterium]